MKLTLYLDVTSSWCFWAEPAWAELKARYEGRVDFSWKIALLTPDVSPASRESMDWFYRRSGTVTRSPRMLNSAWYTRQGEYLVPNLVAEAGKDFGVTDDKLRLALARAALFDGRPILEWDEALAVAAETGLDCRAVRERATSDQVLSRIRGSTAEFHALQLTQRPAFLLEDEIGDRAVFSGLVRAEPIAATIEAMREDVAAYASFEVHFGPPPPN